MVLTPQLHISQPMHTLAMCQTAGKSQLYMWITADKATHLAALLITGVISSLTLAYVSYWVSQMHTEKYKHYLKSCWSCSERQEFISQRHNLCLWGVRKEFWEKEPETGLLCIYTLLHSLTCHLSCELGWEKAMSFSTAVGNDWAL